MESYLVSTSKKSRVVLSALEHLITFDLAPPPAAVLDAGCELRAWRLDRFLSDAIPDRHAHERCARYLLVTAARYHVAGSHTRRADKQHVHTLLRGLQEPREWLFVREVLRKFVALAYEELGTRPMKPLPAGTPVDDEDMAILRALNDWPNLLMNQDQIAGQTAPRVSRRTISSRLATLLEAGLVAQPKGKKSGYAITTAGSALLKTLPESPS
jgi:hypothetical protein